MYYDQSIKPLRDSNRLYYAAITTNQLIDCYREQRKARLGNGARPQVITPAPDIACPPPRRSAEEDPAWVIGNSPAELRADSCKD